MINTDYQTFEKYVANAINTIPKEFTEKFDNVEFFINEFPNLEQKKKINLRKGWTIFGLYEGVPQDKRGINYSGVVSDKITIFKRPIEYYSKDENHLQTIVNNTIWHEIAHHFGMDEKQVREAEFKRGHIY